MKLKGGYTNYGQDVGILLLDTWFPRPPGDIGNALELDTDVLAAERVGMTEAFLGERPDAGAILLECTNMCPFSRHVRKVSGLPVFGIDTMINWFWRGSNPARYLD